MEDILKVVIWLAGIGLYYYIKSRPKADGSGEPPKVLPPEEPRVPKPKDNSPKPMTIEEILEQFKQQAPPEPRPVMEQRPVYKPIEATRSLESPIAKAKSLESTKKESVKSERTAAENKKYQEYLKNREHEYVDSQSKKDFHYAAFAIKKEEENPFTTLFANPASMRTAFIVSEILKPKYLDYE